MLFVARAVQKLTENDHHIPAKMSECCELESINRKGQITLCQFLLS